MLKDHSDLTNEFLEKFWPILSETCGIYFENWYNGFVQNL